MSSKAGRRSPGRTGVAPLALALLACLASLTAVGGLAPSIALAREAEVRGVFKSSDLYNTDLGATVLDGRLDAEVEFGSFILGGAWRGYYLSDPTYNPRGIEHPQPRIKHRYLEVRAESLLAACGLTECALLGSGGPLGGGSLLVRVGDYFSTFGRGLALRSFEDKDLESDTALDGIYGEYRRGGVRVTALSGTYDERVTDARRNEHKITGARVALAREGRLAIGASGLTRRVERRDEGVALPDSLRMFTDDVLGCDLEAWFGPVYLAADYARRRGDSYVEVEQGEDLGHAGYVTATVASPWLTLVGEYKDYWRFANALVNPPTCTMEHAAALINRVTHEVDLGDERGFLVQGDLALFERMPVTAGASEARRDNGDLAHWEIFGDVGAPAGVFGAVTLETSWSREYASGKFTEYITGMIETELEGGETELPLEFGLGAQAIEEPSGETYENYLLSGSWYVTPAATASLIVESTTQDGLERDYWLAGEIAVTLAQGLDVSLGAGTERGGKKCSGGVCYTEPEFAGVRLRLTRLF